VTPEGHCTHNVHQILSGSGTYRNGQFLSFVQNQVDMRGRGTYSAFNSNKMLLVPRIRVVVEEVGRKKLGV